MYGTTGRVPRTQQISASQCWVRLLYGTRSHYEGREQQGLAAARSQDRARGPDAKHLSEDNIDALLDQNRFPNNTDYDRGSHSRGLEGREQQALAAACSQDRVRGPDAKHLSEDNIDALLDQN